MAEKKDKTIKEYLGEQFSRAAEGLKKIFGTPDETSHPKVILLSKLKPTQITVGMRQVELKREQIRKLAKDPEKLTEFLLDRPIRVVLGPGGDAYVIDHHHLALALIREKHQSAPMQVDADYSRLSVGDFWKKMSEMKYMHPHDADGKLRPVSEIPATIEGLVDDPYRSLAGFARNAGAFKKVKTPFAEFEWADYFRTRISKEMLAEKFDKAVKLAVSIANDDAAKDLPGYQSPKKQGKQKPKSP